MKLKILISLNLLLSMVVFTTSMSLVRKDSIEIEVENSPILPHYDDNEWIYENCIKKTTNSTGELLKKILYLNFKLKILNFPFKKLELREVLFLLIY